MLGKTNFSLFILHAFSAIFLFLKKDEVPLRFRKIPVFQQIVQPSSSGEIGFANEKVLEIDLVSLIAIFFSITAFFHLLYFLGRNSWYRSQILSGTNPYRWIEYALSASVMVLILSLTATVQDVYTLTMLVGSTVTIMLIGWAIERSLVRNDVFLAAGLEKIAWILQLVVFAVVAAAFVQTIKTVNKKLTDERATELIPEWVYALLIAELVFFASFGFVSTLQVYKQWNGARTDFINYERSYHFLSLGAKLVLGWLFYFGATKAK